MGLLCDLQLKARVLEDFLFKEVVTQKRAWNKNEDNEDIAYNMLLVIGP